MKPQCCVQLSSCPAKLGTLLAFSPGQAHAGFSSPLVLRPTCSGALASAAAPRVCRGRLTRQEEWEPPLQGSIESPWLERAKGGLRVVSEGRGALNAGEIKSTVADWWPSAKGQVCKC